MKPFTVRYKKDETDMLCVGFVTVGSTVHAVIVMQDGTMGWAPVMALRVEYGNEDWPQGLDDAFSRALFERQPA